MNAARWHAEVLAHVLSQMPDLSTFDNAPAAFWSTAGEGVRLPYVVIDEPDIEAQPMSDGLLETVTFTVARYSRRDLPDQEAALAAMGRLSLYFSPASDPQPVADGGVLVTESLGEVPSDDPNEYALELDVISIISS